MTKYKNKKYILDNWKAYKSILYANFMKGKVRIFKYLLIFITAFVPFALNRNNILEGILSNYGRFYWDFLMALFTAIVLWKLAEIINKKLNRKIPIDKLPVKRLSIQFILTLFPSILLVYIFYLVYSKFIFDMPFSNMVSPNSELLVIILNIFFIIAYYILYDLFVIWKHSSEKLEHIKKKEEQSSKKKDFVLAYSGQNATPVKFDIIAEIHLENKNVLLITFTNKQYLLTKSLNSFFEILPNDSFFRINRQIAVHRKNIKSFKNIENGKLEIFLIRESTTVTVSQKRAGKFRNWFKS